MLLSIKLGGTDGNCEHWALGHVISSLSALNSQSHMTFLSQTDEQYGSPECRQIAGPT